MTKRAWFYCGGCLILGLSVGYFYAQARGNRAVASMFACLNIESVVASQRAANEAYEHESSPVAIYALTQSLDRLTECEQSPTNFTIAGEPFFVSKQQFAFYMMTTHARLAKLYSETGQTNLSVQHIAEALSYAKEGGKYYAVTNDPALMEFISKSAK
jgi:hypothetical protein